MNIYNVGGGGGVVVGVIDIRLLPSLAKKYKYLILLHHIMYSHTTFILFIQFCLSPWFE